MCRKANLWFKGQNLRQILPSEPSSLECDKWSLFRSLPNKKENPVFLWQSDTFAVKSFASGALLRTQGWGVVESLCLLAKPRHSPSDLVTCIWIICHSLFLLSPFMYQYAFYFHDVKDPDLFFQQLMSSSGDVVCLSHSWNSIIC